MRFRASSIAATLIASASLLSAAPTVTYLGSELSQGSGANRGLDWGATTNSGYKAAWRSTDTPPKAFVFAGEENAYGRDGYLCFWTGNSSQGIPGTYFSQALYTGSWAGDNTFVDFAPYVSSIQVLNIANVGNNDGSSRFDDPSLGIGADVDDVQSGTYFCRFYDGSVAETNVALRLTFADNVSFYPRIRIGCVVAHGGQPPKAIHVGGAVGEICGVDAYGWFDWYFFEIQGAAPGDIVDICLEESREAGSASLDAFVIDAPTLQNSQPVISSLAASPATPVFSAGSATTTLSVAATDPDGDTLTYLWSAADGRDADISFATPDAPTCSATMTGAGNFVVSVRISDGITAPVVSNLLVRAEPAAGEFYVEYVGYELSTSQRGSAGAAGWGDATTGAKSAWRSTNTVQKAFVLPGEANAYGRDGYICFSTSEGTLSSGTQSGNTFADVAPYLASVQLENVQDYAGNDGNAQIDDPRAGIGEDVTTIRSGIVHFRFTDGSTRETVRAVRLTFADNAPFYPVVRVGVVNAFLGHTPYAIRCDSAVALTLGTSWYGVYNWYFFDIHNAAPGQTVDIYITENADAGGGSIELLSFDAPTLSNTAPEIDSVACAPAPVPYTNNVGQATLSVAATDIDGDVLRYHWTSTDGRDDYVALSGTNADTCVATFLAPGDFSFEVSVYDGIAAAVKTNITVRVEPPAGSFYVEYAGCDLSTARRDNNGAAGWGTSTTSGAKSAWRSTNTAPKAFVLPGEPNAYGEDGFLCFGTTYTAAPFIDGTLYSGTAHGTTISNIAPFAASLEIVNMAQLTGNDPGAQIDNPLLGIGEDIPSIRSGSCVFNFRDPAVQETNVAFRLTFSDSVRFYPLVRVGLVAAFYGQTPAAIRCSGAVALTTPVVNYGTYDWYFFDIHNAAPGQTVEFLVQENAPQGNGFLEMFTLDAVAPQNDPPAITAVSATPASPAYVGGSATATLRATIADPDGDPFSIVWAVDGEEPGIVALSGADTAECVATLGAPGTYTFRLTASDGIASPATTNIVVTVATPAAGLYTEFAGAEITTTTSMEAVPGGWGPATQGYKRDFRTTDAGNGVGGAKDFVLAGGVNAYGVDGYIFPGNAGSTWPYSSEQELGQFFTGDGFGQIGGYATIFSNVTDYVTSFEFTAPWGNAEGQYTLDRGDMTMIDDPRVAPAAGEIADICAGDIWVYTSGIDFYPLAKIVFNRHVTRHAPIRVGVLVSRGEGRKPTHIALGGTVAKASGQNGYYCNDWYFFDVKNARARDEVILSVRNQGSPTTTLQGIVFDSVLLPPAGTIFIIR